MIDLVPDTTQEAVAESAAVIATTLRLRSMAEVTPAQWHEIDESGLFGLAVSEEDGGSGLGAAEQVLVAIELGAELAPLGIVATMIAAQLMAARRTATDGGGMARFGLADPWRWTPSGQLDSWRTVDAPPAGNVCIISATGVGIGVWNDAALESFDPSVRVGMATPAASGLVHDDGLVARATLLVAAQQVGIARKTQELAVEYAKTREQFGKPIGSFQAVKHACADMAVLTDAALAAVSHASVLLDAGASTGVAVSTAKAVAGEAAISNVRAAMQVFGGIGVTAESELHRYLRRATLLEQLLGPRRTTQKCSCVRKSELDMTSIATEAAQILKGGLRFRGYVRYDKTEGVVDLTLLPVGPRQVVIKTEATQACYTFANWILGDEQKDQAYVPGHGGVGRVVAVGSHVRRFQVGDRALVTITPNCGACYHCINGRGDMCNFLNNDDVNGSSLPEFATMEDGRTVTGGRGGFAEYMVINEEWGTPIFTDLPADQVALLSCVGATGLGPPTLTIPVQPGADVVVFGLGPIGLSAVNGAAIMNAAQIFAIDPVAYRRDVASKLGATTVIDPTGKDDTLVAEIKELCRGRTDRFFAGGRAWYEQRGTALNPGPPTLNARGPNYIFEAVGGERITPSVEPSPDPTGILPLQQAFAMCPSYGSIVTTGVGQRGNVTFAAGDFTNKGRTIYSAQYGRTNVMRDTPKFISMIERGHYRADLISTARYGLADSRKAFEESALRSTISATVVFDAP